MQPCPEQRTSLPASGPCPGPELQGFVVQGFAGSAPGTGELHTRRDYRCTNRIFASPCSDFHENQTYGEQKEYDNFHKSSSTVRRGHALQLPREPKLQVVEVFRCLYTSGIIGVCRRSCNRQPEALALNPQHPEKKCSYQRHMAGCKVYSPDRFEQAEFQDG